jgi:hypothetical protein
VTPGFRFALLALLLVSLAIMSADNVCFVSGQVLQAGG